MSLRRRLFWVAVRQRVDAVLIYAGDLAELVLRKFAVSAAVMAGGSLGLFWGLRLLGVLIRK